MPKKTNGFILIYLLYFCLLGWSKCLHFVNLWSRQNCINIQNWHLFLHKYATIGLLLVFFRFFFSEILHFLRGKIVAGRWGLGMPAGEEQLSVCWQTAVRLLYGQLSVTGPAAVGPVSDSCRTTDRLYFTHSHPVIGYRIYRFRLLEFAVFGCCVLFIWLCVNRIYWILVLKIPYFRPLSLLDGNTGFSQTKYAIWHFNTLPPL